MTTDKKIKVLDLFAGAGGFSLGFHWAGFHTAVAIDHHPAAVETLEVNFGHNGTLSLMKDLATFTPKELKSHLRQIGRGDEFDMIIGGPPCQGFSKVGRGKLRSLRSTSGVSCETKDPRNGLFRRFLDFVDFFRPAVFVMENVPGMLSHGGKNVADQVQSEMTSLGYNVSWSLLNAAHFGVPQVRERLFFIATREDRKQQFNFPKSTDADGSPLYKPVTVKDAIGDLPRIGNGAREWIIKYRAFKKPSDYATRMRRDADQETVFDHVSRLHNAQDLEAFSLMPEGGKYVDLPARLKRYRDDIFEDKYRKLFWKRQSWCVTAHLGRDCYSHIHPAQPRTVSVREVARLQSFPDSFYLGGNLGEKYKILGNAVPPLLAEKIALAIKSQLFGVAEKKVFGRLRPLTKSNTKQPRRVTL